MTTPPTMQCSGTASTSSSPQRTICALSFARARRTRPGHRPSTDRWNFPTRSSNRLTIVSAAHDYGLTPAAAGDMFDRQVDIIRTQWQDVVASAQLTQRDASSLYGRQILNNYALT